MVAASEKWDLRQHACSIGLQSSNEWAFLQRESDSNMFGIPLALFNCPPKFVDRKGTQQWLEKLLESI